MLLNSLKALLSPRALASCGLLAALATPVWAADSTSTSTGDIIWDTPGAPKSGPAPGAPAPAPAPVPAQAAPGAAPDSNGIMWNAPGAPVQGAPAPRAAAAAPAPSGAPDKNGIVWNAPGAPSNAPSHAVAPTYTPPATASAGPDANGVTWDRPHPGTATASAGGSGTCREFQTTITIDGKPQPAHGTVCQQPDGSWRLVRQ